MNRIDSKFKLLKRKGKKAFIAFLTAGDPNLKTTEELVLALEHSGADIVELGVPFSDPLADGPTIQAASGRALAQGVNLPKIFDLVRRIRRQSDIPIAVMTYFNPVFHYGLQRFVHDAKACGIDGVIVPDLPPEEAGDLIKLCRKSDLSTVFFLAPTTTLKRAQSIVKASTGFVYYVSVTGVTGARNQSFGAAAKNRGLAQDSAGASQKFEIEKHIRQIKKFSKLPICVGFGVSTPEQVKDISRFADGVIVGSAIINEITRNSGQHDLVKHVSAFVKKMSEPLKR